MPSEEFDFTKPTHLDFFLAASEKQLTICLDSPGPGRTQRPGLERAQMYVTFALVFVQHGFRFPSISHKIQSVKDGAGLLDIYPPRFQSRASRSPPLKASFKGFCYESKVRDPGVAKANHSQERPQLSWWELQLWLQLPWLQGAALCP